MAEHEKRQGKRFPCLCLTVLVVRIMYGRNGNARTLAAKISVSFGSATQVAEKSVSFPATEVGKIIFIGVCFPFKRNAAVCVPFLE